MLGTEDGIQVLQGRFFFYSLLSFVDFIRFSTNRLR